MQPSQKTELSTPGARGAMAASATVRATSRQFLLSLYPFLSLFLLLSFLCLSSFSFRKSAIQTAGAQKVPVFSFHYDDYNLLYTCTSVKLAAVVTYIQTYKPSIVTLAVHACWGLILCALSVNLVLNLCQTCVKYVSHLCKMCQTYGKLLLSWCKICQTGVKPVSNMCQTRVNPVSNLCQICVKPMLNRVKLVSTLCQTCVQGTWRTRVCRHW